MYEEKYTQTLSLTIQTIFGISMMTIFKDEENIKNIDEIHKIYKEKYIDKVNEREEVDILEIIKEIKDNLKTGDSIDEYKSFLELFIHLFKNLLSVEEKDKTIKDIIDILHCKKDDIEEEGFSEELSKSLVIPELSITKIISEKVKDLNMDDIFFILEPNWKVDIKPEYKKYPSLIFFLLKNPDCEQELIYYLLKTDSIQKKETEKFSTFLLILRIFSDLNCIDLKINTHNFFGSLIREEILSVLKRKDFEVFKKTPDINWIGLLINRPDINKYLSPKMNYIYNYLENFADYPFKPYEENKENYKTIIHKLIDFLINAVFKGKLDELFSEEIINIEDKEDSEKKEIKIKDILYLTKLPDLIQFIIKEENNKKEKKLHKYNI